MELPVHRVALDVLCGVSERCEGDGVAKCFELVHGVGFGFGRFAQGVVVGAEFAVERAVGEHVPRGDDQGVFNGDERTHRPASGFDPLVFGGEERVFPTAPPTLRRLQVHL